tara:strand:+ start:1479 stop:1736 length:258 start_codon:yes stop_codon:yes gene_type:complete
MEARATSDDLLSLPERVVDFFAQVTPKTGNAWSTVDDKRCDLYRSALQDFGVFRVPLMTRRINGWWYLAVDVQGREFYVVAPNSC